MSCVTCHSQVCNFSNLRLILRLTCLQVEVAVVTFIKLTLLKLKKAVVYDDSQSAFSLRSKQLSSNRDGRGYQENLHLLGPPPPATLAPTTQKANMLSHLAADNTVKWR